jgi:S-methylmethionine-dependent homocysteine/selenocysteine methylase
LNNARNQKEDSKDRLTMRKLKVSIYLTLIAALCGYNYTTLVIRSPLSMSTRNPSTKRIGAIFQRLRTDPTRVFILDGGTGEELIRRGVPDDRKIWSATALVYSQYHDSLKNVHKSFLDAGADAVTTNSYGVTPGVGFTLDEIAQYCATASQIARDAVTEHAAAAKTTSTSTEEDGLVFGSLGPLLESYRADKIMEHDQGVAVYTRMAEAMAGLVDAFLAETLSSVEESMQAVQAIGELPESLRRPVMISYSLDGNGAFRSGESVCEGIPRLLDFIGQYEVEGTCIHDDVYL